MKAKIHLPWPIKLFMEIGNFLTMCGFHTRSLVSRLVPLLLAINVHFFFKKKLETEVFKGEATYARELMVQLWQPPSCFSGDTNWGLFPSEPTLGNGGF